MTFTSKLQTATTFSSTYSFTYSSFSDKHGGCYTLNRLDTLPIGSTRYRNPQTFSNDLALLGTLMFKPSGFYTYTQYLTCIQCRGCKLLCI